MKQGRNRRTRQGVSLIEAVITVGLIAIVFVALMQGFNTGAHNVRHEERNSISTDATSAISSDLQAMGMYNLASVENLQAGQQITVNTSGSASPSPNNPVSGNVVFTVTSVTPNVTGREVTVVLSFKNPDGGTGSVTVPVRQMGVDTSACNPAAGQVTACPTPGGN